jgi:hypothetical protein
MLACLCQQHQDERGVVSSRQHGPTTQILLQHLFLKIDSVT